MDSGNSGSIQSSSGGDEQEYDSSSRANQSSNFFNITGLSSSSSSIPNTHHHTFFDLPSSSSSSRHYLNINVINNNNPLSLISSDHQSHPLPPNPPFDHHQGVTLNHNRPFQATPPSPSDLHHHHHAGVINKNVNQNPKKRTRASRRAPTTVLTTDTSNFRAMVQEFTGIPRAPPFSGSPVFPSRTRFDLFRSSGRNFESLFPFHPQKMQPVTPSISSLSSSPSLSLLNQSITVDVTTNPISGINCNNIDNNYNGDDGNNNSNNNNVIATTTTRMVSATMNPINNYNHLALDPHLGLNKLQHLNMLVNPQSNLQAQISSSPPSYQPLLLFNPDHHHPHHHHHDHDPLDQFGHVNMNHGVLQDNHNNDTDVEDQRLRNFGDQTRKGKGLMEKSNNSNVSSTSRDDQGTFDPWICP